MIVCLDIIIQYPEAKGCTVSAWKYFKKFLFFTALTGQCAQNALKQILSKTPLLNVEQP